MTTEAQPSSTIDITNLVAALQKSFVDWAVAYVYGLETAIPGLSWVALPVLSSLDQALVRAIIDLLATSTVMQAFFLNTAIKKASQAQDYLDAIDAKNKLSPTASDADYEKAEQAQMAAFRNFVILIS